MKSLSRSAAKPSCVRSLHQEIVTRIARQREVSDHTPLILATSRADTRRTGAGRNSDRIWYDMCGTGRCCCTRGLWCVWCPSRRVRCCRCVRCAAHGIVRRRRPSGSRCRPLLRDAGLLCPVAELCRRVGAHREMFIHVQRLQGEHLNRVGTSDEGYAALRVTRENCGLAAQQVIKLAATNLTYLLYGCHPLTGGQATPMPQWCRCTRQARVVV
jgi:hypothetical protein